jgi:RNAse (barnase) inhibitor barstar
MPRLIHPDKENWIKSGDEEINALLPTLSDKEKSYLALITSENYDTMVKNIEKYLGVQATSARNLPSLPSILMGGVRKTIQLEAKHRAQLEELALNTVLNLEEFQMVQEAYINDEIRFQVKLDQPTAADFKLGQKDEELTPEESLNQELANILDGKDLSDVNTRRRFANLLITGGAFSKMYLFHLVDEKLKAINPELPKLYGGLGILAELGYWMAPDGVSEMAANNAEQSAGVEEVVPDGDAYIIKAKAITFPYLCHEIVKGIYEWLSIDPDMKAAMGKEKLEHETRDVLAGPALFKKISAMIPAGKQYLMPLIQKKLIALPTKSAQAILAAGEEGKQIFNDLLTQAEAEWDEYKKNKSDYSGF